MGTVKGRRPVASTAPEQHVGEAVSALHPGVPELDEGGHAVAPRLRQHGAAGDEARRRSAGWRRRRRRSAPRRRRGACRRSRSPPVEKPQRVAAGDGALDRRSRSLGEPGLEGGHHVGLVGPGEQGAQVGGAAVADELALVGSGVADHDDRHVGAGGEAAAAARSEPSAWTTSASGRAAAEPVERGDDGWARRRRSTRRRRGCARRRGGRAPRPARTPGRGAGRRGRRRARCGAARRPWRRPRGRAPGGPARPAPRTDGRRVALSVGGVAEQRRRWCG